MNREARIKELEEEVKRLQGEITIKILENAKGAQVLSNVEERNKELEASLKRLREGIEEVISGINNYMREEEIINELKKIVGEEMNIEKGEWIFLKGKGKKLKASLWFFAPSEDVSFYIDNVRVKKLSWLQKMWRRIWI